MADPKSIAGEVEGDYSVVKVQLAAGTTDDKVTRPTKGTQLVWGGNDPSSPWGHLAKLIEKAGSVAYTYIHAADLRPQAADAADAGDAPADDKQAEKPAQADAQPDAKPDEKHSAGGIEGTGPLFEFGLDFTFDANPARVWAHPHCMLAGPRPLVVLLHGINKAEALDHPLLNENGHHEGKIAHALIEAGKVTPLIVAAPTQKRNDVWLNFDFEKFIEALVEQLKAQSVEVDRDQVAIVGHSAAGGYESGGMDLVATKAATFGGHKLKVLGLADTRASEDQGALFKKKMSGNSDTAIYSIFRPRGGWLKPGDSYDAFARGLGVKSAAKPTSPEDEQDIVKYADDGGKHICIEVDTSKVARHHKDWQAAGGFSDKRSAFEHSDHWDIVPLWFSWALPRFYPAQEADKHAGLQPHVQEPPPPEEKPRSLITGGEWADVPPAAAPLADPGSDPKPTGDAIFAPPTGIFWPVRNPKIHEGRMVSFVDVNNKKHGVAPNGRDFLANRPVGTVQRYHAGIDVFADDGDLIVACEAGKVITTYHFYKNVHCLLIQHGTVVINYGEVKPESLVKFGMKKGVTVQPGQPVAQAGRMSSQAMLHFETYPVGTQRNVSIKQADKNQLLKQIYNPTQYLLALAANGK